MTRTLTLARAVAPPTARKLDGAGVDEAGAGGKAIAAIRSKGPIMTVMVTVEDHHGYHLVRDCSETEQLCFDETMIHAPGLAA